MVMSLNSLLSTVDHGGVQQEASVNNVYAYLKLDSLEGVTTILSVSMDYHHIIKVHEVP